MSGLLSFPCSFFHFFYLFFFPCRPISAPASAAGCGCGPEPCGTGRKKREKERRCFSLRSLTVLLLLFFLTSCGEGGLQKDPAGGNRLSETATVVMSLGQRIATLDPALAGDTTSQYVAAAFYDTPLQYEYDRKGYRLKPSMLKKMPEISADGKVFRCELREDLYFQDGPPFHGLEKSARQVKARDLVFSLLRLADARLHSPGYWLVRGKITGLDDFRKRSAKAEKNDFSPYDTGCAGLKVLDDFTFEIHLDTPDPRLAYALALPYCAAVSRRAAEYYGEDFADHPHGSGPFLLAEWSKDYLIRMRRNPEFREETFPGAERPDDRKRRLPLSDEIICYLVKQPLASWLMFLQGELDFYALDGDNFEAVVNEDLELAPTLRARGIRLIQAPELQTNYIGFNFTDPVLGKNADLRRAISLAFDKPMRVAHSGGRFAEAYGPIPPGAPGHVEGRKGPYGEQNLEEARRYLALAGYPGGIDPATGEVLELSFDQSGSDTFYRQTAELLSTDLSKIGIRVRAEFNTRPRFLQKLQSGQFQLFRFSWTADYPDAENFLQLFYGPNSGSCNRVFYNDPEYDRMYEEIAGMPDSPERTAKYEAMAEYLLERCPWIFETHTVAFVLAHDWMTNYIPHDFAFNRWKYLSADAGKRRELRKSFRPVRMGELRNGRNHAKRQTDTSEATAKGNPSCRKTPSQESKPGSAAER